MDDEPLYASTLYMSIKQTANIAQLSAAEIITLVAMSVSGADRFNNLSGPAKKRVVLHVIAMLLAELPAEHAQVRDAVTLLAPAMIDMLVAVAKAAANSATAARVEVEVTNATQGQCHCVVS